VSPDAPVTLIAHDWGAYWGYMLHLRHPELITRLVGMDIAPEMKPTPREVFFLIVYQWWLVGALVAGGPIGDWMTRRMARLARTPRQGSVLDAGMNYPYLYAWRDVVTGRTGKIFKGYSPSIPILFIYGEKKLGHFHTDRWLDVVRRLPGGKVVALETDHWVTKDPKLKTIVREWLESRPG
jgi:pimeloyl-ACP methyl ester carboxylesterase